MNASTPDKSRFFDWKMLVVLCAALLGGAILVGANSSIRGMDEGYSRGLAARTDLSSLSNALRLYALKSGQLPTEEQGLAALVELPELEPVPKHWTQQLRDFDLLTDRWGNEYVYSLGSDGEDFHLRSLGPDGLDQTEDDITFPNVAPASSR